MSRALLFYRLRLRLWLFLLAFWPQVAAMLIILLCAVVMSLLSLEVW